MTSVPPALSQVTAAPRLGWIDAARGVSIALIVLLHARIVLGGVGVEAPALTWMDDVAGHLRIPLFFTASGLLAARWTTAPWTALLRHRLAPLIWVFLIWQPVVLAYKLAEWWLLRDELAERWGWQVGQFALSVVRPVGELWFLWALVIFLVLLRLTARVPLVLRLGVPALASIAWTALLEPRLGPDILEALGSGWGGVVKYFVFFLVAATFSSQIRRFFSVTPRWAAAAMFVGWLALTVLVIESGFPVHGVRSALFALGAAAGLALGRVLEPLGAVRALGRNTLPVYVAHLPIIVALVIAAAALGLPAVLAEAPVPAVLVVAGAAIALALVLHRVLARSRVGALMYVPPPWFRGLGARDRVR